MSEPYQLVGKIYGDKQHLIKQRSSMIAPAHIYDDWHYMSNDQRNNDAISYSITKAYSGKTFNELRDLYFNHLPFSGVEIDNYNETEKCWEILLFFFSDNYVDFITVLNALRQVATQSNGTVAIVPFMYGNGFDDAIILDINENTSKIHTRANAEFTSWAEDWFESIIKSHQGDD